MIEAFDTVFRDMKPWQIHTSCLAFIFFLGYLDYDTGAELSFSVFYLLPISVAAWYLKGRPCYTYSVLAACVWDYSNVMAGEQLSLPILYFWNGAVRLGFFLTVSTLLQRLRAQLKREQTLSRRDFLTGLLNRRAFFEAMSAEYSRSVRKSRPIAVAYIDLDHFKQVNDQMGHAEGDRVLVEVARTLERNLRGSDLISRLGGDEFAILLPECSLDDAHGVANKVVHCLRELSQREQWPVTASVGIAVQEQPGSSDKLEEFLKSSDKLMYEVKQQGRNRFLVQAYAS